MVRAVVTGGAGFIGSHLVEALIERGVRVLVIDNLVTGYRANLERLRAAPDALELLELDIRDPSIAEHIARFAPDGIFHLAAQMDVRKSVRDPLFDSSVNVGGTVQLLSALAQANGKFFVFASTGGAIYGEQSAFPAAEDHPVHPECPYGVSKRCGELYLEYFARKSGIACTALRFANVYGPRQNAKGEAGVVAIFSERLLRGEAIRINGAGEQTRDFVYAGDVVRAMLAAQARKSHGFEAFNVGTGIETSLLSLVATLRNIWEEGAPGFTAPVRFSEVTHGPALPGEQQRSVIDIARISRELGWKPEVSLRDGLARTLISFRDAASIREARA